LSQGFDPERPLVVMELPIKHPLRAEKGIQYLGVDGQHRWLAITADPDYRQRVMLRLGIRYEDFKFSCIVLKFYTPVPTLERISWGTLSCRRRSVFGSR
jgi:hypothetical protein